MVGGTKIIKMKKYKRFWLLMLVLLLIVALVISCQPAASELMPNRAVTEKPPTVEPSNDLSYLVDSNPAEVDNSNLPITPVAELHVTSQAPKVEIGEYQLTVDGLVGTPLTLTYEALMTYPTVTEVVLLICPFSFADNAEWTGIPVTTLLAEAGIKPEAEKVVFHALDKYKAELPLEVVHQGSVFLAHTVNGQVLPIDHGYPLRLVARGRYGYDWVKWVEHIEVI